MKEKKYLLDYPDLCREFDMDKNIDTDFSTITMGMNKKIWWKCKLGHEWEASPNNRQRTGCPYCAGKRVLRGFNDLESHYPEIVSEWDYDKNVIMPYEVMCKTPKMVWWKCKNGHSWQARISNRVSLGRGCPICSNQKVLTGYNDLSTVNPDLSEEWNYEKNDKLPTEVGLGTEYKAWWKCKKYGHEWQARIVDRICGNGCPYCSGRSTLPGFNDLATIRPELLLEWDYDKNDCMPSMISPSNGKKVWWRCFRGHSYKTAIYNRAKGTGCPYCIAETKTSFPEQAIYFYLSKVAVVENRYTGFGKEIDIYLPKLKIGIEYNGKYYHKNKKDKDKEKKEFLQDKGICIISVNESDRYYSDDEIIEYIYEDGAKGLKWVIETICKKLKLCIHDIDINADRIKIYEQYVESQKNNSILIKYPKIAKSWNYERNGSVTPDMISAGSQKRFWWKCKEGHEWQAVVKNIASLSRGCPYCSGQKVLGGFNDLETRYPDIASEWNKTKNGSVLPNMILPHSNKKYWWLGRCGHEWESTPANRVNGNGCPICANKTIINGENDFASLFPQLLEEWDSKKNSISPLQIGAGSARYAWWKCKKCGYQWKATVVSRTKAKSGCPCCAGKVIKAGYNDLKKFAPELIKEWDYSTNTVLPEQVAPHSNKKVWWKCAICCYGWAAAPNSRMMGRGCPVCANKIIISGVNDLESVAPQLTVEWIYEKNEIKPSEIGAGSSKKIWWRCSKCGHEWCSSVANRTRGHGCPKCAVEKRVKSRVKRKESGHN